MKRRVSLAELYREKKNEKRPVDIFFERIKKATGRGDMAIKFWIAGKVVPDQLVRHAIAEELDVDENYLFPVVDESTRATSRD